MADTAVNPETKIESVHDCDSLRSGMCANCAERGSVTEIATCNGLETKFICENCGSNMGVY